MDIHIDPHNKKINLKVNGPLSLSEIKVLRHFSPAGKESKSNKIPTFAAGQTEWWIERNSNFFNERNSNFFNERNQITPQERSSEGGRRSAQITARYTSKATVQTLKDEEIHDCEEEADKYAEMSRINEKLKKEKLEVAREKLKVRLRENALKKSEAFQKVIAQYNKESIQSHAPYLNPVSRSKQKKLEKDRILTTIPKALSVEDLDINELPLERTYMVLGKEKYSLQQRYFDQTSVNESKTSLEAYNQKELEKELRTSYRIGHLDEIKKRQFGKVYDETRKHYMDRERYEFLEEQKKRNSKKNAVKTKIKEPGEPVKVAWKPVGPAPVPLVVRHTK